MSEPANPSADTGPQEPAPEAPAGPATGPGRERTVEIFCERCGAANLVRVKGCWYCERCHYKFDCYGW